MDFNERLSLKIFDEVWKKCK